MSKIEQWDKAAHLCVSEHCRFGRTTAVNGYIISTVGEYVPAQLWNGSRHTQNAAERFETVGYNRLYETMVFKDSGQRCAIPECKCGRLPEPVEWSEIDFAPADTREQAIANHERLSEQYAAKPTVSHDPV